MSLHLRAGTHFCYTPTKLLWFTRQIYHRTQTHRQREGGCHPVLTLYSRLKPVSHTATQQTRASLVPAGNTECLAVGLSLKTANGLSPASVLCDGDTYAVRVWDWRVECEEVMYLHIHGMAGVGTRFAHGKDEQAMRYALAAWRYPAGCHQWNAGVS